MPSRARVDWRGPELRAKLVRATTDAIDETTAAADHAATTGHWWRNRTGNLERQIITEPARLEGAKVVGKFGTTYAGGIKGVRDGFYGLFLEMRHPFLRPAADLTFPTLARRIARRLRG